MRARHRAGKDEKEHRHSNEFMTVFVSQVTMPNTPPVGVALS